mmetsp:Transcript_24313/g.43127  ORF Transcript_24313/g.43127 Transcript_24313/m.43127 type:complete len:503 (-) Transcript_24313:12-1520(-)
MSMDHLTYPEQKVLRTGSYNGVADRSGPVINMPLNRYGLMTKKRKARIHSRSNSNLYGALPQSAPLTSQGFGMHTDSFNLESSSTFRWFLETSKSVVYLPEGECSQIMTIFNMANCLVGSGILGLPFSLAVGGWCGLLVMFVATVGTSYTGKIIGKCIEHLHVKFPGTGRDRYQDMAELSCKSRFLGRLFKYTVNISIVLELWGGACSRIILQGDNLHKVFPEYSKIEFMVACTCVVLPSVFIGMEYLSYLSMMGLTSSLLLLLGILIAGVNKGVSDDTIPIRIEGLPITFGIVLFSYSGHAVFPQIYRAMKDKQGYSLAVDSAFYISFAFYATMAIGGYLFWGSSTKDQITLNLPEGMWSDAIILLMVVNTILSYPLIMTAPIEAVEDFCGITGIRFDRPALFLAGSIVARSVLVVGTLVVALTVTNFGLIATFIGAVFTMAVSLIFPCVIYLKMLHFDLPPNLREEKGISVGEIWFNIFLILLGFLGMVTGVYQGITQLT